MALTLVFAGGAAGKLVCGFLGAGIGMSLLLPLGAVLAVLPAIGIALNGTSSVLYGTVPELAPAEKRQRAFGLFYTGTIGAGALSPAMYGLVGDVLGIPVAMLLIAALVLITLPLAWRLSALLKGTGVIVA